MPKHIRRLRISKKFEPTICFIRLKRIDEMSRLFRASLKNTDSAFRQNLIRTMALWKIAGMLNLIQYRNTLFLEAPLLI
jgi:hypothetical protein